MAKTIIFANGLCTDYEKIKKYIEPEDTIICADGGTVHALELGIIPHFIIGDLDSLPADIQERMRLEDVDFRQFPVKKDKTDLELALELAKEQGASEILILTALGGRLDQSIANILLLARPEWQPCTIGLAEGEQQAWLLHAPAELTIHGRPGDTISIVPLTPDISGVDLTGFEWPVRNATFNFGSTLPISNSMKRNEAYIRISKGIALIVHIPDNLT